MGEPFFLQYGNFPGHAIEALMFSAKGYEELDRLVRQSRAQAFVRRLKSLLAKGESPELVAKCEKCGEPALFISGKRGSDGVGFGQFLCSDCARSPYPGEEFFALKFSTLLRFRHEADRRLFLRHLKVACGFTATELMTAEKANAFFYRTASTSEPQPKPEPRPSRREMRKGPVLPL